MDKACVATKNKQARRTAAIIESVKVLGHGLQAQAARHLTVVGIPEG